jgi:eukaryotic-like serine/threonine-protein kinase
MVAARLIDVGSEGRQHVDRYELIAEIASGGMATVFLARLSGVGGFQRLVAIKRLHPHLAREKEFVEMFLDEARLAAGIHHPNVVPILEVGASERGYYLVMEYVEGDTLARLLARAASTGEKLPAEIALRIVLDMMAGLHAAHELKDELGQPTELVHRDVSPQNVLVGMDGIARITDFGVARAASRLSATRTGQLKGKVAYMAPEQAMGRSDIDRRADVFASGIVLWEVLAGRRLFKAENEAGTLSRVLSDPIPELSSAAPEIDPELAAVTMKALERDRERRYSTLAQFADSVERAASAAGKLASARELAAYVKQVLGQEIEAQRDAVRGWLACSEPSRVGRSAPPATSVSSAAMAMSGERDGVTVAGFPVPSGAPAPPPRRTWPLVAMAVSLAGALTLAGVLLFQRSAQTEPPAPAAAPPPPVAAPAPAPEPSPTPSEPAPPPAQAADAAAAASAPAPEIRPTPPSPAPLPLRPGAKPGKSGKGEDLPSNPYR